MALGTHSAHLYSFVSVAAAFLFSAPPSLVACVPRYTAGSKNTDYVCFTFSSVLKTCWLFYLNPHKSWAPLLRLHLRYTLQCWWAPSAFPLPPNKTNSPLPPRCTLYCFQESLVPPHTFLYPLADAAGSTGSNSEKWSDPGRREGGEPALQNLGLDGGTSGSLLNPWGGTHV